MNQAGLFAGIGLLIGIASGVVHQFERKAAHDIAAQLVGPGIVVKVRAVPDGPVNGLAGSLSLAEIDASHFRTNGIPLFVDPERSQAGSIKTLRINLHDFYLKGLHVESLTSEIPDCRYDRGLAIGRKQIRLSHSGEGQGYVRILASDLEQFILTKFHEIKRVRVRLVADTVYVEGYGEFLVVSADFKVRAHLGISHLRKLELVDTTVWLDGKRTSGLVADSLLKTLNPVVDLDRDLGLYGAVDLERLRAWNGVLEAWGRTRIPVRPHS